MELNDCTTPNFKEVCEYDNLYLILTYPVHVLQIQCDTGIMKYAVQGITFVYFLMQTQLSEENIWRELCV